MHCGALRIMQCIELRGTPRSGCSALLPCRRRRPHTKPACGQRRCYMALQAAKQQRWSTSWNAFPKPQKVHLMTLGISSQVHGV